MIRSHTFSALVVVCALLFAAESAVGEKAADGTDYVCEPGYDCVGQQITPVDPTLPVPCSTGYVCPDGKSVSMCGKGKYCPTPTVELDCEAGHWCPSASSHMFQCPPLSLCPAKAYKFFWGLLLLLAIVICVASYIGYKYVQRKRKEADERTRALLSAKLPGTPIVVSPKMTPGAARRKNGGVRLSATVAFNEVCVDVVVGQSKRRVLHNVSGQFRSGRLTAVMGPSGCGKTTFLNALANRVPIASGSISVNGVTALSKLKKVLGFVPQDDIMLPMLTVRDILNHSARTRLPNDWTDRERLRLVDEVMDVLGIADIAESVIGDELARGISGGQKKRVNIAMELVADPLILFLDEPTSGLDAHSAQEVVQALDRVCLRGTTVITVIHQPRFEIFTAFKDVLLLGAGGHTVYLGPTKHTVAYFARIGFAPPEIGNPADFFLDVMAGRVAYDEQLRAKYRAKKQQRQNRKSQSMAEPPSKESAGLLSSNSETSTTTLPINADPLPNSSSNESTDVVVGGDRHRSSTALHLSEKDLLEKLFSAWTDFTKKRSERLALSRLQHNQAMQLGGSANFSSSSNNNTNGNTNANANSGIAPAFSTGYGAVEMQPVKSATGGSSAQVVVISPVANIPLSDEKFDDEDFSLTEMQSLTNMPGGAHASHASQPITTTLEGEALEEMEELFKRQTVGPVQLYLMELYRSALREWRDMWPTGLDTALQLLPGLAMGVASLDRETYQPPLPENLAVLCPSLVRDTCMNEAILGDPLPIICFFLTMVVGAAATTFSVNTFGKYSAVLTRERETGLRVIPYSLARMTWDILHVLRVTLLFCSCYFFLGSPRGSLGEWIGIIFCLLFAAYGLGYFVSVLVRFERAAVIAVVAAVAFSVTSGLTPTLDTVANWWPLNFLWYISYNRWSAEAIIWLGVSGQPIDGDRMSAGVRAMGYTPDNLAVDCGVTFVIGIFWRILTVLALKFVHRANKKTKRAHKTVA